MNTRICFFNDPATTEIYPLSLLDALPIYHLHANRLRSSRPMHYKIARARRGSLLPAVDTSSPPQSYRRPQSQSAGRSQARSEEHTSELQSRQYLVCRLLLEKKKIDIAKRT